MEKKKNKLVTLKKNKEFTFVYHRGKSCATRRMVLVYFKNKYGGLRSGFSVSKKVGGAVVRNKVRRRMKECMREILKTHPDTSHASLETLGDASYAELSRDMRYLLKKAGLLTERSQKDGAAH